MYRLLIVEDNKRDREGLLNFIDWDSLGIEVSGYACDGLEGKTLAGKIRPHIIITDIMMPKLDGIQMSRDIRAFLPESKIILLSGYDDFQYAKQSFEFHAFAYLLKPVQKDFLEDTLHRTLKALYNEDNRKMEVRFLQNQWVDLVRVNKARLFLDFLECKIGMKHIQEVISENEMNVHVKTIVAILSLFPNTDTKNQTEGEAASIDQTVYLKKIDYLLSKKERLLFHSKPLKEVVLCMEAPATQHELETQMLDMTNTLRNNLGVEIIFGIGDTVDSLADASQSYMQAREIINFSCLADYGELLFYSKLKEANKNLWDTAAPLLLQVNDITEGLTYCIQKGKIDDGIALADGFLAALKAKRFASRMVLSTFIISILKGLGILLPDFFYECNQNSYEMLKLEFVEPESFQQTRQYVLGILSSYAVVEKEKGHHEDVARKIIGIIETSYAEALDLKRIAQEVYLSPYYVGSIFKRYTGKAFSQYLNDYRIRKAKQMLLNKDMKLNDLARLVGIHNPSYFSELFKQKYGLTPGVYKELTKGIQESV